MLPYWRNRGLLYCRPPAPTGIYLKAKKDGVDQPGIDQGALDLNLSWYLCVSIFSLLLYQHNALPSVVEFFSENQATSPHNVFFCFFF